MFGKDVLIYDSGIQGPVIGILALTHGNEPAGLLANKQFVKQGIGKKLIRGKVMLISVNQKAYKLNKRFVDINMNRIGKFLDMKDAYEYKRMQELMPLLDQCDIVLDIHSVSKKSNTRMGISHTKDAELARKILKTDRLLIDDNFDNEGSLISFVTKRGGVGFGIECGYHEQDDAWKNALDNIVSLLTYYDMIATEYTYQTKTSLQGVYKFHEEIFPRTTKFKFVKEFENFDQVQPGEIYAIDDDVEYKNSTDGILVLGILGNKVILGDGIGFIFTYNGIYR